MSKHDKLGMNASTAAHRLRMDILFDMAVRAGHKCFRCGHPLIRKTFSIEHKIAWEGAPNPKEAFFDLSNIAFSHLGCNCRAGRKPNQEYNASPEGIAARLERRSRHARAAYTKQERHSRYLKTGN